MEAYEHSFDGLVVFGRNPRACHFHAVDRGSRAEAVCKEAHGVAFVVVFDGVGKVYGVCRVGTERVVEGNLDLLALGADIGSLHLWR